LDAARNGLDLSILDQDVGVIEIANGAVERENDSTFEEEPTSTIATRCRADRRP
jgi:hypothetical protein